MIDFLLRLTHNLYYASLSCPTVGNTARRCASALKNKCSEINVADTHHGVEQTILPTQPLNEEGNKVGAYIVLFSTKVNAQSLLCKLILPDCRNRPISCRITQ